MCDFCDPSVLDKQTITKGKYTAIIYPREPIIFGHLMIIPKEHKETLLEMTVDEIIECHDMAIRLYKVFADKDQATGFNLFVNSGKSAGQHVPHVHYHIFMRKDSEKASPYDVLNGKAKKEILTPATWGERKQTIIQWLA